MAKTAILFANYMIDRTQADQGRLISFTQDWIGVGIVVASVSQGVQGVFGVQWSSDNATWVDDPTPIGTATVPGTLVQKYQIRNLYWRVGIIVSGANPNINASAAAIF